MEGPLNGHIYATVNSVKAESELEIMKSPSPNILEGNNHRTPHGHHYIPQRSPKAALSPRPNVGHMIQSSSDSDKRFPREDKSHSAGYHGQRKVKDHDQNYHPPKFV